MIVKNEEKVLAKCLSSARPWVGEIIVVDTGSSDNTIAIAKEYGAKVSQITWENDFSAARNASFSKATGDWILWLDADDILPESTGKALRSLVDNAPVPCGGFYFLYSTKQPAERGGGVKRQHRLNLVRNHPSIRFSGRVHEQISESVRNAGFETIEAGLEITHQHYDFSPQGQAKKTALYTEILEQVVIDEPEVLPHWYNLGVSYSGGTFEKGPQIDKAILAFERFLGKSTGQSAMSHTAFSQLIELYRQKGNLLAAQETLQRALKIFPDSPQLLFIGSAVAEQAGDILKAEHLLLQIINATYPAIPDNTNTAIITSWPRHNLGMLYLRCNRLKEAKQYFLEALAFAPDASLTLQALQEVERRISRGE